VCSGTTLPFDVTWVNMISLAITQTTLFLTNRPRKQTEGDLTSLAATGLISGDIHMGQEKD